MSTDSTPEPLGITDPRRQAADTIRAYEYQIWQSVSRWVTLKPGEALFLEKAEDFDVVGEGWAETTQVKDTSRSGANNSEFRGRPRSNFQFLGTSAEESQLPNIIQVSHDVATRDGEVEPFRRR